MTQQQLQRLSDALRRLSHRIYHDTVDEEDINEIDHWLELIDAELKRKETP